MTEKKQIYKCEICGNIIKVLENGPGQLVCCGKHMNLLEEKTQEQGNEKHLPILQREQEKVSVKVGDIEHPMKQEHYIQWIEVITENKTYRKELNPNQKPQASFIIAQIEKILLIRAYCNIHGLWKKRL